jgi:PEP-CTERM motif
MRFQLPALFFATSLLAFTAASAETITITETTTASGALGADHFGPEAVTFTFIGDTSDVTLAGTGLYHLEPISPVTVTIATVGTFSIEDPVHAFTENSAYSPSLIGAGITDEYTGFQLFVLDPAFDPFLLDSDIGPITSSGDNFTNVGIDLTNGENLNFFTGGAVTYTATVTDVTSSPEPSSLLLFATGTAGLLVSVRRRLR